MEGETMTIEHLKEYFQDCNLNFLIGSGASRPFLGTLGNIEKLLTQLEEKNDIDQVKKRNLKFIIYNSYFSIAMKNNLELLESVENENKDLKITLNAYKEFIKTINQLLLKRGSAILNKQVNIFTTNIDILFEKSVEDIGVEFNDGFYGRLDPIFNLNQFKKLRHSTSYLQENLSECPVFNLFKIHGSINWIKKGESIYYDRNLESIKKLKKLVKNFEMNNKTKDEVGDIDTLLKSLCLEKVMKNKEKVDSFLGTYYKLQIVNPTKKKFKDTVLNQIYYDILRIYANELEKENTVLIVFGFSFADEHIRSITVRALNSNPTLTMIVFAYTEEAKKSIENEINKSKPSNNNIIYCAPKKCENYDLKTINEEYFNKILQ